MVINLDLQEIKEGILTPLNEVLLISYGTEIYHQILLNIEQTVKDLEKQNTKNSSWQ